ncbi:hypothetical protein ABG067_003380 [Albugo candida]
MGSQHEAASEQSEVKVKSTRRKKEHTINCILPEKCILHAAATCSISSSLSTEDTLLPDNPTSLQPQVDVILESLPIKPDNCKLKVYQSNSNCMIFESDEAFFFVMHMRYTSREMVHTILGSAVPLSFPYIYRFGGARIHLPFWRQAKSQIKTLLDTYTLAHANQKLLIICGHSVAGSMAHLMLAELLYQIHPLVNGSHRNALTELDAEAKKKNIVGNAREVGRVSSTSDVFKAFSQKSTGETATDLNVYSVGFGSPYAGSVELHDFLVALNASSHAITFVNEMDCLPSILNIAQSAAMLCKTSERFLTIAKATGSLLRLLPGRMQYLLSTSADNGGKFGPTATSAYLTMSFRLLQSTFEKLRSHNLIAGADYQYAPCGTYIFLRKDTSKTFSSASPSIILDELESESARTPFSGDCVLQHSINAYLDSISKRTAFIRVQKSMNYYERLQLPRDASSRQIRSAYRSLALTWHPDRWNAANFRPQDRQVAEEAFKLLAESYEVLSDPVTRKAYDEHLDQGVSLKEEFMRHGTVHGVTLDEAINTFRNVYHNASAALNKVANQLHASSSTAAGQRADLVRKSKVQHSQGLIADNHRNIFAPGRIRIVRKITEQERVMYIRPDEIRPGDVAAPSKLNSGAKVRTASIVGGAVVVGASVALAVNAWSHYSDSYKRYKQAETVRTMPAEFLICMLQEHHQEKRAKLAIDDAKNRLTKQRQPPRGAKVAAASADTLEDSGKLLCDEDGCGKLQTGLDRTEASCYLDEEEADDHLVEEFYDCATTLTSATQEAMAEEEFFDCVALAEAVCINFDEENPQKATQSSQPCNELPVGAAVSTPFGLGRIMEWITTKSIVKIQIFELGDTVAYVHKHFVTRGAESAVAKCFQKLDCKRMLLSERVIQHFGLSQGPDNHELLKNLVGAGKLGALDSGLRATGGILLAKGVARTSAFRGTAAPLAIASILVDVGKEYYDYRQKHMERKQLGILSEASEQLIMNEFRLRTGQHVVSGASAAAGAGIGAYGISTSVALWTGVGLTGPVGFVAATGAAVIGGMLGYLAGSQVYSHYTCKYFQDQQLAREHINRLEMGARILFNEYDPQELGLIKRSDCIKIMTKLYEASRLVSTDGFEGAVSMLQQSEENEYISWASFWEWVSTEAIKSLRRMELENAQKQTENVGDLWWEQYTQAFTYFLGRRDPPAADDDLVRDGKSSALVSKKALSSVDLSRESLNRDTGAQAEFSMSVLNAQIEYLLNCGYLTETDAYELETLLDSNDPTMQLSARRTVAGMFEAYESQAGVGDNSRIDEAFSAPKQSTTSRKPILKRKQQERSELESINNEQEQLNVLCSLLSTDGIRRFLKDHGVDASTCASSENHEDLHCLALKEAISP